jgi:Contractile injection system tube protein
VTTFPGSPRLLKGAIVGIDPVNPLASVIVFQYNPETLTRTLQAQAGAEGGDRSEALRLKGPPVETFKLEVEIDATDQLEKADPTAEAMGIFPQLSALEMLIYPKSALVITNTALLVAGTIEVIAPDAPFVLFVWGPKRVLPVRLTDFSITEESYDPSLNPIRAKVSLGLRVLSYSDFSVTHPGYHVFLAHQMAKETMATIGSAGNLAAAGGSALGLP